LKRVSLKDIARELGVSIATVSLVLNGKNVAGRVSSEMSQKIMVLELHARKLMKIIHLLG
jgi:LacI family transcriptional regulator